jgi:hypothetical protein
VFLVFSAPLSLHRITGYHTDDDYDVDDDDHGTFPVRVAHASI